MKKRAPARFFIGAGVYALLGQATLSTRYRRLADGEAAERRWASVSIDLLALIAHAPSAGAPSANRGDEAFKRKNCQKRRCIH